MSLVLRKRDGETWLDAALRHARPYGLERDVREDYERFVASGDPENEAAFNACYEWDVLELGE